MFFMVPLRGNEPQIEQYAFLNDPSLPFFNYSDRADLIHAFNKRYGNEYTVSDDSYLNEGADRLIDSIYRGLKVLYPRFMSNKAKPNVVVVESDDSMDLQAFMPTEQGKDRQGMIVITTGFIKSKQSPSVKVGWVAHELAHLFLWHQGSRISPIRIYYPSKKIMQSEASAFQDWFTIAGTIGWLTQPESNGISFVSGLGTRFGDFISKLGKIETPFCGEALVNKLVERREEISNFMSRYEWDFIFDTPAKLENLNQSTQDIIRLINQCIERNNIKNEISIRELDLKVLKSAGVAVGENETKVTFQRYLQISRAGQVRLRELEQQFDKKTIQYYSAEDQADEVAVTFLRILDLNYTEFSFSFLDVLQGDKDKCSQALEKGEIPPYGNLGDENHSPCWRIYKTIQYGKNNLKVPYLN